MILHWRSYHPFFFTSLRRDFELDPIFKHLPLFVEFFHLFFLFQDGILKYSFHSKIDFEFWLFVNKWNRIPLRVPEAGRTWILCRIAFDISILSSDRIQFPGARRRSGCCCCCCCECQLLLSVTFGASWGVESLSICRHKIVYDYCTWFRLPEPAFSFRFSPKMLRGVLKIVCRPSLLCFPPAMSLFSRMDWMLKGQNLRNTNSFQS